MKFAFYRKLFFFSVQEEYSSLSTLVGSLFLYPCFIWIFSKLWLGLNHNISSLGFDSLFTYIGLTEILFLTILREPLIDKANADFALSFIRPRSWPLSTQVALFSRTISRRCLYLLLYLLCMPLFIRDFEPVWLAAGRFFLFLPLISGIDTLYSFVFISLQIRFHSVKNFRLLFGKLFLIFGGVLAPLSDISMPWRNFFLNTPFADIVFQPCYCAIKGEFYEISFFHWLSKIGLQIASLWIIGSWVYYRSRIHYHNFGG